MHGSSVSRRIVCLHYSAISPWDTQLLSCSLSEALEVEPAAAAAAAATVEAQPDLDGDCSARTRCRVLDSAIAVLLPWLPAQPLHVAAQQLHQLKCGLRLANECSQAAQQLQGLSSALADQRRCVVSLSLLTLAEDLLTNAFDKLELAVQHAKSLAESFVGALTALSSSTPRVHNVSRLSNRLNIAACSRCTVFRLRGCSECCDRSL